MAGDPGSQTGQALRLRGFQHRLAAQVPGHRLFGGPVAGCHRHGLLGGDPGGKHVQGCRLENSVVGAHQSCDHRLAQAPGRRDDDLAAVAGGGVGGEHDPCRIRINHDLDDHRQGDRLRIHAGPHPVGHGPLGPQRGPAFTDRIQQVPGANDIQVGVLLPGETGLRQVLGSGGGTHGDRYAAAAGAQ